MRVQMPFRVTPYQAVIQKFRRRRAISLQSPGQPCRRDLPIGAAVGPGIGAAMSDIAIEVENRNMVDAGDVVGRVGEGDIGFAASDI